MVSETSSEAGFRARRNHWIVSLALLGFVLMLCIYYQIASRWFPFDGLPALVVALVSWLLWVAHLGWMRCRFARATTRLRTVFALFLGTVACSIIAMLLASDLGERIGKTLCFREVRKAVDAGLQTDCQSLIRHWPISDDRIYDSSPEYANLPWSMRMLSPGYVVNDSMDDTNMVPNIGLCKNGFGGFAEGVRVFRNDPEAEQFIADCKRIMVLGRDFGCERIAAGVYFWWQDT